MLNFTSKSERAATIVKTGYLGIFLILCLLFGGTSQELYTLKLPLYLLSIVTIAVILIHQRFRALDGISSPPFLLCVLFFILAALYLVPLPVTFWTGLQGRTPISEGYELLGAPLPNLPLSLTPEHTFLSLLGFLPPIAVALITAVSSRKAVNKAFVALVAVAVFSACLGVLQTFSGQASWYIYEITNKGKPVGVFSNVNHQACFLVMAIIILIYLMNTRRSIKIFNLKISAIGLRALQYAALLLLGSTIMMTNSIAGISLLFFAAVALSLTTRTTPIITKRKIIMAGIFAIFVLLSVTFMDGLQNQITGKLESQSALSRTIVFSDTQAAIKNFGFFGTGLGSFSDIYPMFESRDAVTWIYMPQAHNDYIQTYLELGVLGAALVALFLIWFIVQIVKTLIKAKSSLSIILLIAMSIPILHSAVDYPLRAFSLSTMFAFLLMSYVRFETD